MDRKDSIIIVGGGLGGLTAALALARHGFMVRVLEGAPEFGAIGYGIQFGPNVFHAFDRIGVSAAVLEKADAPPAVLMIDAFNGKEVTRVATGRPAFRDRFKYPYIIIHRIDLHNVLLDACRRDALITLVDDAMATRFEERGDRHRGDRRRPQLSRRGADRRRRHPLAYARAAVRRRRAGATALWLFAPSCRWPM